MGNDKLGIIEISSHQLPGCLSNAYGNPGMLVAGVEAVIGVAAHTDCQYPKTNSLPPRSCICIIADFERLCKHLIFPLICPHPGNMYAICCGEGNEGIGAGECFFSLHEILIILTLGKCINQLALTDSENTDTRKQRCEY